MADAISSIKGLGNLAAYNTAQATGTHANNAGPASANSGGSNVSKGATVRNAEVKTVRPEGDLSSHNNQAMLARVAQNITFRPDSGDSGAAAGIGKELGPVGSSTTQVKVDIDRAMASGKGMVTDIKV